MTISRGLMQQSSSQFGSQSYITPGTYTFITPPGVYSISAVAVGGGGSGGTWGGIGGADGGYGASLAYVNNVATFPGKSYTVVVGLGGTAVAGGGNNGNSGGASYMAPSTGGIFLNADGGSGGYGVYSSGSGCGGGTCFLAGSLVVMADRSFRKIEDVQIGEYLMGAFGESNRVIAKDNPIVGDRYMYNINDEHVTCDDHPHVSPDKKFYSCDVDAICNVWGEFFLCSLGDGSTLMLRNQGLDNPRDRIKQLTEGVELLHIDGSKKVTSVKKQTYDPNTRLYNFVLGGSHTYYVNGYCVTAWPRDDDFDYINWVAKDKKLTLRDYQ